LIAKGKIINSVYKVEKALGSGAQGVIYHVKTISTGFDLALKLIEITADEKIIYNDILEAIKSEFTIIKSLHHPNIISVYDFGYDKKLDKYYYTMDYLQGMDLRDFVAKGAKSSDFPALVYQMLDGLNYLHSNNIIHFDIKPENIFIVEKDGQPLVKILDFGLSEIKKHNKQATGAKGTLSYIAPEFFLDPTKISPKIDLYSLGVSLIHVNKGVRVTAGPDTAKGSIIEAMNAEYEKNTVYLSEFKDKRVRAFISQLTEKNPGTRISSAVEAIISLNRIFGTDFKIPLVHHITSFLNNPKFVLRDETFNQINVLRESTVRKAAGKSVVVTGNAGAGKTKLFNQMIFLASLKLEKILKMYLDDNTSEEFFIGKLLLKKIYNLYGGEPEIEQLYTRIEKDLSVIIEKEQNFSYIFDDMINFIFKCSMTSDARLTLIFDNYERYDSVSVRFVNRLLNINKNEGSIFLAVSIATDKMNDAVAQSYKLMEYDPDVKKIDLPALTYHQIEQAIDIFLGRINSAPNDFSKKIYDFSGGNFRKLMSFFDEFFNQGVLNYVSGLLLFRDEKKFGSVLRSGSGKSVKRIIDSLDASETKILRLLCAAFNKLTVSEIQKFVPVGEYDLKKCLNKLVSNELVSGYNDLYRAIRSEVKDYVFKHTPGIELIDIYEFVTELDLTDKFSQYSAMMIKSLTSDSKNHGLRSIDKFVEKLSRHDSNDNLFYLLLNSLKMYDDSEIKFRIEINYAKYLFKKDNERSLKLINDLDRRYRKKDRKIANRISFIELKMYMLDPEIFNYDAAEFVKTVFPIMEKGLRKEEMYRLVIKFIDKLLHHGEYFGQGVEIINILEEKFGADRNISFETPNYLNVIKFLHGVIPWKNEYEKILSDYISEHIKHRLFNDTYFRLLDAVAKLVEKEYLEGDYERRLAFGLNVAYEQKNVDQMFQMYTALSTYHYYRGKYEISLYWDQKRIELKEKLKKELTVDDIGDMGTTKANLYYPIGEVIGLIQETRRLAKEKNDFNNYILYLTNEFILLHRKGDFKLAKTTIRKAYLYFRSLPEDQLIRHYERVAKYFPEIFSREEAVRDADNLRAGGTISDSLFAQIKEYLNKYYEHKVCYRWSPERVDEVISGKLELETPMMLLLYLKQHRKLAELNKVMGEIDPRFLNPECTGDHLVFIVTKFMMTKDTKLLDPAFELFRKLYISGYVMIAFYTLVPFIESALMYNIKKERLKVFIEFYEEIRHYIDENMDDVQKKLFEHNYFNRRGRKILEFYHKL
jgi:serine/threonine protein kinase